MNNHELLNMIGEVNEDYVLAAEDGGAQPRLRWKAWAACAACAALILGGAYPAYLAAHPDAPSMKNALALHPYTVVEGGSLVTEDELTQKSPAEDRAADSDPEAAFDATSPAGAPGYSESGDADTGMGTDGEKYWVEDVPVDDVAAGQYGKLLQGLGGVDGMEPASYPEWFAGAWIDHGGAFETPAWLTVAIVEGSHTPELEAEITRWCGSGVVFQDAKYSRNFLDGLMEPAAKALDGTGLSCGIGVDVISNCLGVDIYSGGDSIPEAVLAELARLDPAGDAIRVRLFTGKIDTLTDEIIKGPAPEPVDPEARATPTVTEDGQPVLGGKTGPAPGGAQEGGAQEATQPAVCGEPKPTPAPAGDLPGYDILYGADE